VQADLPDFGPAYYGDHYQRLRGIKATYDPSHTFRFPQDLR
jgi:FAD/FMN-containing dehydrogenase